MLKKIFLLIIIFICLGYGKIFSQERMHNDSISKHLQRTWLQNEKIRLPTASDNFLQSLKGSMRVMVCSYDDNKLAKSYTLENNTIKIDNAVWNCTTSISSSPTKKDELEITCTFELLSGEMKSAGVAVAFDFSNWDHNNYVFAPAQLYNGNRFRILPIQYPPYIHDAKYRPLDMTITTTDILHLNEDGSHAKVEMNTGNVATPMLGFFNQKRNRGFILITEQQTRFGNNGLFVEEDAGEDISNKRISFVVSAPGVREERYVMCGRAASDDKAANWKAGDKVTLKFKLYNFKAIDMPAFYQKVFESRKTLSGKNSYPTITPYSEAANLVVEHHNKDKWEENDSTAYYCNHPGDPNPYNYQIGWGGIPVITFPELILETPERLRRVTLSFDSMLFKSQAKSGLFYAMNRNGKIFGDEHGRLNVRTNIAMTRRSMEVLYYGLMSLDLLRKRNHQDIIKPEWEQSLKKCADGLVKVWRKYRQFGQFINVDNLEMDVNGSTAGAFAAASLALASKYFNDPEYLLVAEASADYYYKRDFLKGYAGGGAAEILQSPDSEAPWDMVESCMTLYDVTGNKKWVELGKFAANMLSTWMVSYDYKFPEGSRMNMAGTHAAGSIFASSQNNHSAPGYYILSGDMMLKLYRATGDKRYAEMYKDQSHNVIQYVGAPFNPLRHESGFVTERVQLSDWEGKNQGSVDDQDSNMAWEILTALTSLMNPGIYLHTDDTTFLVMDHVRASVIKRDKEGVTIKITNPTPYNAAVSIFAESEKQSKKPYALNAFDKWPKIKIQTGETKVIFINESGTIKAL